MKKIISSFCLIAGTALSTAAIAEGPTVKVGGFIDFQAASVDQDSAYAIDSVTTSIGTRHYSRDFNFQNDTEIHFLIDGKTDNGLGYGAVIELNADVTGDADSDGGNADRTFIYLESIAGRGELGNTTSATNAMKVDAATIAAGTGGVDGDFYDFVNLTQSGANYIFAPDLPTDYNMNIKEDATKVSYYSPRWSGLQVGFSFTPDDGNGGTAAGFTGQNNSGDQENVVDVGFNYENTYKNGLGVKASLVGETGQSEVAAVEDLNAWQSGLVLSYQGFSVAGSYVDWGDSGLAVGSTTDSQSLWTAGAAYENGPYAVSLTYLDSEGTDGTGKDEFSNVVLGADYQLAPGLVPYIELNVFETDDNDVATTDNEGTALLFGTELNF